ncbi:hypothetical protein PT974_10764 [Cladobotryum mycophilum]|uniref:Uncharacterized protein n=1 Tax=Cladobotryum mycophilum TaxID=491253 RepID=A0ABR0SAT9_9HYPO
MLFKPFAFFAIALTAFSAVVEASALDDICDGTFHTSMTSLNDAKNFIMRMTPSAGDKVAPRFAKKVSLVAEEIGKIAEKLQDVGYLDPADDQAVFDCYSDYFGNAYRVLRFAHDKGDWVHETKPVIKAALELWKVAELNMSKQMVRLISRMWKPTFEVYGEQFEGGFNATIAKY